jgi:hypothetical protein
MRLEFLLCEAPEAMPIDPATGLQTKPPRFRSPLPLPGVGGPASPLRSPVTKFKTTRGSSINTFHVEPAAVTRALRSSMTLVRKMIPSFVISPCVPLCLVGHDINNMPTRLRASNRAVAMRAVELLKRQKSVSLSGRASASPSSPTYSSSSSSSSSSAVTTATATNGLARAIELAAEAEALNELATVTGVHGVQVFIAHWMGGIDASTVRDLNARLLAADSHTSGAADRGGGIGASRVWDDTHNASRTWRSASELRASGPGEAHIITRPEDIGVSALTAEAVAGAAATATSVPTSPGGSGGGRNARMLIKSPPASPSSKSKKKPPRNKNNKYLTPDKKQAGSGSSLLTDAADILPSPKRRPRDGPGDLVGARILEVLGARGTSGRGDLRSVFTAEAVRHDAVHLRQPLSTVAGRVHLGEMCFSIGKDGSVVCAAAIDAVDDRIVFAPSSAEASRVGAAGRYSGDRTSVGTPGVSLDKLSKTIAGLQINAMDMLRCVLLDNNDPSSERASHFAAVHGDCRAEPCGFVSMVAGSIRPFMKPAQYLDGSEYEIRLVQLIGRVSGGAFDVGLGAGACTLFVGERGTLLIAKRPERFHASLIEHAQWKSRDLALDAMQAQTDFLGACVSRVVLQRSGRTMDTYQTAGLGGSNPTKDELPMALGEGSDDPEALLLRISRLLACMSMLREGMRSSRDSSTATEPGPGDDEGLPVWEDGENSNLTGGGSVAGDAYGVGTSSSSSPSRKQNKEEDADGRPSGVATAFKESFKGSDTDVMSVRELRRVLEIRGLRASAAHRAECLETRLKRLRGILRDAVFSGSRLSSAHEMSGGMDGVMANMTGSEAAIGRGVVMVAGSAAGRGAGGGGGGGGGGSGGGGLMFGGGSWSAAGSSSFLPSLSFLGTVGVVLLSALVAIALFDTIKDDTTQALPWESGEEAAATAATDKWAWLGMNVGLWGAIVVLFLCVPLMLRKLSRACTCCKLRCCCRTIAIARGPRIKISVAPVLRIDIAEFERQLLQTCTVMDDRLGMPRFALGGGQAAVASAVSSRIDIGSGNDSLRVRRGRRVVVFREPVSALGWPGGASAQWRGRSIVTHAEIKYDGSQHGGAVLQNLRLEIENAPPSWPYRWLHELILIKWLDRLEEMGIATPEDVHVARRVLRLGSSFD